MANRLEASLQLAKEDLLYQTDTPSAVNNIISFVRNVPIALFRGVGNIIPSLANGLGGQEYDVVKRNGPLDGTSTAIQKITGTKGILGKVSALVLEAPDDLISDGINIFTGGAGHVIKPRTRSNIQKVLANEPHYASAA